MHRHGDRPQRKGFGCREAAPRALAAGSRGCVLVVSMTGRTTSQSRSAQGRRTCRSCINRFIPPREGFHPPQPGQPWKAHGVGAASSVILLVEPSTTASKGVSWSR